MKQREMSVYLRLVTIVITILFLAFSGWFLPFVLKDLVLNNTGETEYRLACIFIWITAIPCLLCLWKFWGICVRIGRNQSFCRENANALKRMSHFMLVDCVLYVIVLAAACIMGWYQYSIGFLFGIVVILFICVFIAVASAALSHLVYKASQLQDDQDLTI